MPSVSPRSPLVFALAVVMALVGLSGSAAAGQETAGSIVGRIVDEGGGVLPGVTVTAKSPSLQVTEVVGRHGRFRRLSSDTAAHWHLRGVLLAHWVQHGPP